MRAQEIQKPIDGALYAYKKGFKIFPIKINEKIPAVNDWQNWYKKVNEDFLKSFGVSNPTMNWGICCGSSGLTVLDIDNKHGKSGSESLDKLLAEKGQLPSTLTVKTPSNGIHYYFTGDLKNSVSKLGEGIDTRGKGGYVVAPGSRINGVHYEVINDTITQNLPSWITKQLTNKKEEPKRIEETIESGDRNNMLTSLAGTMRNRGMNHESILAALLTINETQMDSPLDDEEVKIIAASVAKYTPETAKAASDFLIVPKLRSSIVSNIEENKIPKRDWIMQNRYIGGFISVLVAPGGVGKSTLSMLDAVSISTGMPLSGFQVTKKGAVWVYNTEDPKDELKRRFVALCDNHDIDIKRLSNIHYNSGREQPLILAKHGHDGVIINNNAIDAMIEYINENNIVVLLADPFVRTHEVNENDNMQIDKVVWCFQRIADKTGCAVGLVHHTRKPGAGKTNGDMNDARGASSLVNAARIAHTLSPMSEEECESFGINPDRRGWYMRLDNAKANLQAPAERADWFEKRSIELCNGDTVGSIERVELQDMQTERKIEELNGECKDLAFAFNEMFELGDKKSISSLAGIVTSPQYPHLFRRKDQTKRHVIDWLVELLQNSLYFGHKKFSYEYIPDKKPAHWIRCEKIESYLT